MVYPKGVQQNDKILPATTYIEQNRCFLWLMDRNNAHYGSVFASSNKNAFPHEMWMPIG